MIRRGLSLAVVFWLMPAPAYAHAVGPGGGVELELLLVAGAILFFGVKLRSSETAKPWAPWAVMAVGVALGVLSFAIPQLMSPNVSIRITSPESDQTVPAGRPVEVEVEVTGASVARSASDSGKGHLHVFVDGELAQMPYSTSTEIELEPGRHELAVEYFDAQHIRYDPPIRTSIEVSATQE